MHLMCYECYLERGLLLTYYFLQAIEDRYGRKNELYGSEATFDTDSDRVLLDIDKDAW